MSIPAQAIIVPTLDGVRVEMSSRHGHSILTTVGTVADAKQYVRESYGERVTFRFNPSIGLVTALI